MKINKSELFKKAWKIAKTAAVKFNDSARRFFSESLKQAWKNLSRIDIEKLKEKGKEWIRGDHHRIYFNDLLQYISGELKKWQIRQIGSSSVYYDVNKSTFLVDDVVQDYWSEIRKGIVG